MPAEFLAAVTRIDYSSASAKVNLALSEPPRFSVSDREVGPNGLGPHHHGTMHIGPSLEYLERAYDDAKYGQPSQRADSGTDDADQRRSNDRPAGQAHPVDLRAVRAVQAGRGRLGRHREAFADRCIEVLAHYAPNVPGAILHRQVLTPLDLERTFGLTGGNILQGAMTPGSTLLAAPGRRLGRSSHAGPGLYLCGAATHPGGGVMGACGKNAAAEILRDM